MRSLIGGALASGVLLFGLTSIARAHGEHAAQPSGIIDPLVTHHAVLEDELKLNFFGSDDDFSSSLELAYAFTDLVGVETFVPFTTNGFGDIELQFPKLSFVRRYGWVMTAYAAVVFPTSSGSGEWVVAPHLLTDLAWGPVGLQLNAALEVVTDGEVAAELRASVAYTFELSHTKEVFLSPLVEVDSEVPLHDEEPGLVGIGGLKLGWGGWHVGAGVGVPLAGDAPFAYEAMVQLGYHVTWDRLFRAGQ